MRKTFGGAWTVFLLLIGICVPMVHANIITVQQSGPITTLGQALGQAGPGDTINVVAGPSDYVEGSLVVGVGNLIIQGQSGTPRWTGTRLTLTSSGCTLRNLEIDGQKAAGFTTLVRLTPSASNSLIESCTIVNPASGTGSGNIGGRTSQSQDSDITGAASAISLEDCGNVTIRNCNFQNSSAVGFYTQPGTYHEVNIASLSLSGVADTIVIEGCSFRAPVRNIQFF